MKKSSFLIVIFFIAFAYLFSAMYSLHKIHESIYFDNRQLSKDYVEWGQLRKNFKDDINVSLLRKVSNDEEFKKSGEVGFLLAGLASKFAEHAVDAYINPEGLSVLVKNSNKSSKIPEPSIGTLALGISLMNFDGFNSFHVNVESNGENIPIHFKRIGVKWKIVHIELSDDFIDQFIQG